MGKIRAFSAKYEEKMRIYLSHHPQLYALVVGIGIVIFWRGVWHTVDFMHTYIVTFNGNMTTDSLSGAWWDGPLSFAVGIIILFAAGAFTSSFIGNELILSGLKREKKIAQKTETEIKGEEEFIGDLKQELEVMTEKVGELEREVHKKI